MRRRSGSATPTRRRESTQRVIDRQLDGHISRCGNVPEALREEVRPLLLDQASRAALEPRRFVLGPRLVAALDATLDQPIAGANLVPGDGAVGRKRKDCK